MTDYSPEGALRRLEGTGGRQFSMVLRPALLGMNAPNRSLSLLCCTNETFSPLGAALGGRLAVDVKWTAPGGPWATVRHQKIIHTCWTFPWQRGGGLQASQAQ